MFYSLNWSFRVWGRKITEVMCLISLHHIKGTTYQHDFSLFVVLTFYFLADIVFIRLLHCKVPICFVISDNEIILAGISFCENTLRAGGWALTSRMIFNLPLLIAPRINFH